MCRSFAASRRSPTRRSRGCARRPGSRPRGSTRPAPVSWWSTTRAREPLLQGILAQLRRASLKDIAALVGGIERGAPTRSAARPRARCSCPPGSRTPRTRNVPPTKSDVPGLFSARVAARLADAVARDGVQHQSVRGRGQHAADAVERRADRAAGVAGVEPGAPPQCRFPRRAGDLGLGRAGQSARRLDRDLADQARRLDPRPHRRRLAARHRRACWNSARRAPGSCATARSSRSRRPSSRSATSSSSIPAR